jgi:hypothetical protein
MQLTNVMIIKNKSIYLYCNANVFGDKTLRERNFKDKRWDYAGGMVFLCTTTTMDIT